MSVRYKGQEEEDRLKSSKRKCASQSEVGCLFRTLTRMIAGLPSAAGVKTATVSMYVGLSDNCCMKVGNVGPS